VKNLRVYSPLVNGDELPFEFDSGKALIQTITNDWGPPPLSLVLEAQTDDGQTVRITIPYDPFSPALAAVEGTRGGKP